MEAAAAKSLHDIARAIAVEWIKSDEERYKPTHEDVEHLKCTVHLCNVIIAFAEHGNE